MTRAVLDVYAALIGLVVGSFLNAVIHRVPRGQSLVRPGSRCPWCGSPIRVRDNLPLLSFLLLRGRCRQCSAPIAWRYPLVELVTAAAFVVCAERFGPRLEAAAAATFLAFLLALAVIDVEHFLLPDSLTFPGMAAGLALQPWIPGVTLLEAIAGVLVGAGLLFLIAEGWAWMRQEEGMGLGDAKLLAMVGAFLGWKGVLITLFLACLTGSLVGIALLVTARGGAKTRLPFGAFLALGAAATLFWGTAALDRYLRLL